MKASLSILLSMFALLMVGCSIDVPLCEGEHPHQAVIDFHYDWSRATGKHPDSMYVLAVRPVQLMKYVYRVSARQNGNEGVLEFGPDAERHVMQAEQYNVTLTAQDGSDSIVSRTRYNDCGMDSLLMHCGEYNVMTYNGMNDQMDASVQNFELYPQIPSDSVWIVLKPLKSLKDYPGGEYQDWQDHNAYSQYIPGLDSLSIYTASAKLDIPDNANRTTTHVSCTFQPLPVSQRVNIIYRCRPKEEGIVLDSVVCELSGIVGRMQMATRKLDVSKTYKSLFRPTFTPAGGAASDVLTVKGCLNVPGVVRNSTRGTVTGPGVLQTALYIHYTDQDDKIIHRTLQASINLFNLLTETPSVMYNVDGDVVQTCDEITITIDNLLQLTHEKVEVVDALGGDQWVDETSIYIDQTN